MSQLLLPFDSIPDGMRCIVCGFQSSDDAVIAEHVHRCGGMVRSDLFDEAKRIYDEAIAERRRGKPKIVAALPDQEPFEDWLARQQDEPNE